MYKVHAVLKVDSNAAGMEYSMQKSIASYIDMNGLFVAEPFVRDIVKLLEKHKGE